MYQCGNLYEYVDVSSTLATQRSVADPIKKRRVSDDELSKRAGQADCLGNE